jgi:hypothetical protein
MQVGVDLWVRNLKKLRDPYFSRLAQPLSGYVVALPFPLMAGLPPKANTLVYAHPRAFEVYGARWLGEVICIAEI